MSVPANPSEPLYHPLPQTHPDAIHPLTLSPFYVCLPVATAPFYLYANCLPQSYCVYYGERSHGMGGAAIEREESGSLRV